MSVTSSPRAVVRANALVINAVWTALNADLPAGFRLGGVDFRTDGTWGGDLWMPDCQMPLHLYDFPSPQAFVARVLDIAEGEARVARNAARTVQ